MKTLSLPSSLPKRKGAKTGTVPLSAAVNLRSNHAGDLVPVAPPQIFPRLQGCTPLCRLNTDGGKNMIIVSAGRHLLAADERVAAMGALTANDLLPAEPLCAIARSNDGAMVMTDKGVATISLDSDGRPVISTPAERYDALTLRAVDGPRASAVVPGRKMSVDYSGTRRIGRADGDTLTADLERAYNDLCRQAAGAGACVQPLIMRYKLYNTVGRCLFTSPPVLLAPQGGSQCARPIAVYTSDARYIDSYTLSANTFFVELDLPAGNDTTVASARIYATPMFHPYLPGSTPHVSANGGIGSDAFAHIELPGRAAGIDNGYTGATEKVVSAALAHMDSIERHVATINTPLSGTQRTIRLQWAVDADAATTATALHKALAEKVATVPRTDVLLSAPHTFSAACCAADASAAAWGDITVHRYAGYGIMPFVAHTASDSSGIWRATSIVRFADGTGVTFTEEHSGSYPTAISPVVSYPRPDAVSMTIVVVAGTKVLGRSFAMEPVVNGRMSAYIDSESKPISLTAGNVDTVTVTEGSEHYPDLLVVAPADNPLAIERRVHLGGGAIKNIVLRKGTDQSWEYGRTRFVVAAAAGIYSVTVAAALASVAVRCLCDRGVTRADALCAADAGVCYALVGKGANGPDLIEISPNGRTKIFTPASYYVSLAYNTIAAELWAVRSDGTCDIFDLTEDSCYRRTDTPLTATADVGGALPLALGPGGEIYDLCREEPSASGVEVSFTIHGYRRDVAPMMPRAITALMATISFKGSLSLDAADISGNNSWQICTLDVAGTVLSPLSTAVHSRSVRCLVAQIRARVDNDFVLKGFDIDYE